MKPLIIYHADCADGFGAAFAAWLKLGDEAEYLPMRYEQSYDEFYLSEDGTFDSSLTIWNREIYILDFNFPRWIMDGLFMLAKRVVWIDHHKSAFEALGRSDLVRYHCRDRVFPYSATILDNNKSGALLAWEYFHPGDEIPILIQHIDDYDRWRFKLYGTREFNTVLNSYRPWTFEQWKTKFLYLPVLGCNLTHVEANCFARLYAEGHAVLRAHEQNVQAVVKGATRKCRIIHTEPLSGGEHWQANILVDQTGLAANCPPHLSSDVGHALATQSGTYGLLWHINKDLKCLCSLRSNGDYDVSAIAKTFGGGGHKNAAGFEVPVATLLEWLR